MIRIAGGIVLAITLLTLAGFGIQAVVTAIEHH